MPSAKFHRIHAKISDTHGFPLLSLATRWGAACPLALRWILACRRVAGNLLVAHRVTEWPVGLITTRLSLPVRVLRTNLCTSVSTFESTIDCIIDAVLPSVLASVLLSVHQASKLEATVGVGGRRGNRCRVSAWQCLAGPILRAPARLCHDFIQPLEAKTSSEVHLIVCRSLSDPTSAGIYRFLACLVDSRPEAQLLGRPAAKPPVSIKY